MKLKRSLVVVGQIVMEINLVIFMLPLDIIAYIFYAIFFDLVRY